MPQKENSTIVFNIFLHGLPGSGKKTFLSWLVENGNILDANFLKAIKHEQEQIKNQINNYMKNIKELPRILKLNIDSLIQNGKFKEAKTYFENSNSRIQELFKFYDEEIGRCLKKSVQNLHNSRSDTKTWQTNNFSSIDIVGSSPNMIYRIHYIKEIHPDYIQFNTFLSFMDGVIFIWDAQRQRTDSNFRLFKELLNNFPINNQYPLIIALNKVDLPHIIRSEDLRRLLTQIQLEERLQTTFFTDIVYSGLIVFETVCILGTNIRKVLINCVRMITNKNQAQIQEFQKIIYQEARV